MYVAAYRNTERGAKPKFREPVTAQTDNLIEINRERRQEWERRERINIAAEQKRQACMAAARKAEADERRERLISRLDEAHEAAMAKKHQRLPTRVIIEAVAARYEVTFDDIVGARRYAWLIPIRFEAIREVADMRPDMGLPAIGRAFNRDHTSILHALKKTAKDGEHWRTNRAPA